MKKLLPFLLLALLLTSCAPKLRFINHEPPDLKVDQTQIESLAQCSGGSAYDLVQCSNLPAFPGLSDSTYYHVPDQFGGLDPALPMLAVHSMPDYKSGVDLGEPVYNAGCMAQNQVRYIVYQDGQFKLLKNPADLKAAYAPIESENEALSYALSMGLLETNYGMQEVEGLKYYVKIVEDTHVTQKEDGYHVFLYTFARCGCGPHTYDGIEVVVSRQGDVSFTNRAPVLSNPQYENLCVD